MAGKLSDAELQQLAAQLRCPEGDEGLKVAELMNVSNANIIAMTISSLGLKQGDKILEIGPGNAAHVAALMNTVPDISYRGVDISATMVAEAVKICKGLPNATFTLTDGKSLPFQDGAFSKAFTVNTVYFWEDVHAYAKEIARIISTGGIFSMGFIPKRVMQKIPFARYGFTMYAEAEIRSVLEASGFEVLHEITEKEHIAGTTGELIEREFVVVTVQKV
jgi:ubiquinone/menaquinone biosynthesis C-methylase UbiE